MVLLLKLFLATVFLSTALWTINIRPLSRTFFIGEVGVVTWFVGLVGGDTVMLVEVVVILLLMDADGLVLSEGGNKKTVV